MEAKQFEEELSDLETRVDRLRALYENWFRGYEKLEPSVARKDVERRVYGLRKELPRNTALRFRYNQLYQRYTSLTTYWGRTARQIEDGTHRLQLQRLKRKKEKIEERVEARRERQREGDSDRPDPRSYELDLDESLSVADLLDDLEMDEVAKAVDTPGPHSEPPPPQPAPAKATFARPKRAASMPPRKGIQLDPLPPSEPPASGGHGLKNGWFDDERPTGTHAPVLAAPPAARPAAAPTAPQKTNAGLGGLPGAPKPGLPEAPKASLPSPNLPPLGGLPPTKAPSLGGLPPPKAPSGAGLPPAKPPATPALPPAAATVAGSGPKLPAGAPKMPVPPPPPNLGAPPLKPAPMASVGSAPKPAPATVQASGVRAPAARPAPTQSGSTIVGQPAPSSPIASSSNSALNDQRLKRIYDEYAAARRKNNEGEVRYEALRSSIERMLPDLQKKHAGKQIDFEVVVKDGRVGLKPKAT